MVRLLLYVFFKLFFFFKFRSQRKLQTALHQLFHSPHGPYSWGWASLKQCSSRCAVSTLCFGHWSGPVPFPQMRLVLCFSVIILELCS